MALPTIERLGERVGVGCQSRNRVLTMDDAGVG